MLEDYLEVRPEKRDALAKHVANGRLLVGPWYTLPDACSCSGEALVRNLLRGHRQAAGFGRVTKVGYTPNGFGQPSQLPQLYGGFGTDSILFCRGVPRHEVKEQFIWEGPDGTRAFAIRLASMPVTISSSWSTGRSFTAARRSSASIAGPKARCLSGWTARSPTSRITCSTSSRSSIPTKSCPAWRRCLRWTPPPARPRS